MKIYLAGYYNGKASAYEIKAGQYDYFLESYHYINNVRHCRMIRKDGRKIFLDSGAYSMFTQKVKVDLDAYVRFVKTNQDILETVSNLDHIGQGGEQITWDNQQYLEGQGIAIQPVFHVRDKDVWLERYLDAGYDYIFIGGMVPESTEYLRTRLDWLWSQYLQDRNGKPRVRVHGFGLTVLELMQRYPWYSVDSTSWVLTGRFGSIYVRLPEGPVVKVVISGKSPRVKDRDMHYNTLSKEHRQRLDQLIEAQGYTADELREVYWKRDLWNIAFFRSLCDQPAPRFTAEPGLM